MAAGGRAACVTRLTRGAPHRPRRHPRHSPPTALTTSLEKNAPLCLPLSSRLQLNATPNIGVYTTRCGVTLSMRQPACDGEKERTSGSGRAQYRVMLVRCCGSVGCVAHCQLCRTRDPCTSSAPLTWGKVAAAASHRCKRQQRVGCSREGNDEGMRQEALVVCLTAPSPLADRIAHAVLAIQGRASPRCCPPLQQSARLQTAECRSPTAAPLMCGAGEPASEAEPKAPRSDRQASRGR